MRLRAAFPLLALALLASCADSEAPMQQQAQVQQQDIDSGSVSDAPESETMHRAVDEDAVK